MMPRKIILFPLLSLFAVACAPVAPNQNAKTPPVQAAATTNGEQCQARAKSRLSLFDRPDTYPINDNEKRNAYLALYNECMRAYEVQVASPKPGFEYVADNNAGLASLSPAAGGNTSSSTPTRGGIITYANGTTVIDPAQLANLAPAAGGKSVSGVNGSTVVVVQGAAPAVAYPAPPTRPSAIPVTPTMAVPAPAQAAPATAAAPSVVTTATASETVAPKPAKKKTAAKEQNTAKDSRSRFERNAVPVDVDIVRKKQDLNALQPSAGSVLDDAVNINHKPSKD